MRRQFYAGLAWSLYQMAQLLPLSWGRQLGLGLAKLATLASPRQLRRARSNLALAYPELSNEERELILSGCQRHLGRNFFHTLVAPRLLSQDNAIVEASGENSSDRSISEWLSSLLDAEQGVLILGGHMGCWELAGGWLAQEIDKLGRGPLGVVTGTIHNPPINRMVQNWRRKMGLITLPRDGGAAPLLKMVKGGGVVAILLDQQTEVSNVDAPFFGHLAPTPAAMAKLALKYSIPVLPVAAMWDNVGQVHVMRHCSPIMPDDFDEGDLVGFLSACNSALESFIRGNPEQWVWFHRRWPDTNQNEGKEVS